MRELSYSIKNPSKNFYLDDKFNICLVSRFSFFNVLFAFDS